MAATENELGPRWLLRYKVSCVQFAHVRPSAGARGRAETPEGQMPESPHAVTGSKLSVAGQRKADSWERQDNAEALRLDLRDPQAISDQAGWNDA